MPRQAGKIPVGVSSCLIGEKVRYDGGDKNNAYITGILANYFHFIHFCPEVACGLGVPRPPIQLRQTSRGIRCIGVEDRQLDVTDTLRSCAEQQSHWLSGLCGYILKKNSPSCGIQDVRIFPDGPPTRTGVGLFAGFLQERFPLLPLEEENRLDNARICENFLQRVLVLHRWRQLLATPLTPHRLQDFHNRHQLLAMSRNRKLADDLGHLSASAEKDAIRRTADRYIRRLLTGLKKTATRNDHIGVLRHILKLVKQSLEAEDSAALQAALINYKNQKTTLAQPVELLKMHLYKHPNPFLQQSNYLDPDPAILALYRKI